MIARFARAVVFGGVIVAAGFILLVPPARAVIEASTGGTDTPLPELGELPQRSLVYARDGTTLLAALHTEQNRSPVPLTEVPKHVVDAIVDVEDERFWDHGGVDLRATMRALMSNVSAGDVREGGSTITQQLVKNALLTPERSVDRKVREAVLSVRMEDELSKRQILERYLNVIELGPGVHGIGAAARHWFGKPARDLTVKEAAFLAAMTPEPRSMSRRLAEAGGLDARSAERVDTVLRHMRRAGVISEAERAAARGARLAFRTEALTGPRVSRRGAGSR